MRSITAALIVLACELNASATPAQAPDIDELMRRVGTYAQRFVDTFSNIVAEERYEQRLGGGRRQLTSDFLLVAYPGRTNRVLTFRDVREVDGQPVKDQPDRITQLFLNPFDSAIGRATEIQLEGLRHGLSGGRLVNPLATLAILQREYQGDFRFSRQGLDRTLGSDIRRIDLIRLRPPEPTSRGAPCGCPRPQARLSGPSCASTVSEAREPPRRSRSIASYGFACRSRWRTRSGTSAASRPTAISVASTFAPNPHSTRPLPRLHVDHFTRALTSSADRDSPAGSNDGSRSLPNFAPCHRAARSIQR